MKTLRSQEQKIWVVFSDETEIGWLKILKKGFRHCFAIIHKKGYWLTIDPLSHYTQVDIHDLEQGFDLPQWLENRGHQVIEVKATRPPEKMAPVLPFTCVEAVKRMIGLHSWTVITPWQLYKTLKR